jgi:tetratricopeptide (TPR) repeat protein
MAKKLTRKELLKGPDEFMTFSERVVRYAHDHLRMFIYAGVTLCVLILGYLGVTWYMDYGDKRGQEVYNEAYYAIRSAEERGEVLDDPAVPADLFRKVSSDHGMARVNPLALPQLARLEFREGRVREAVQLYRNFKEKKRRDKSYASMAGLALAACFEAEQSYDEAVRELSPLIEPPGSFLREQALIRLVRVHMLNGRPEKARENYDELAEAFPDSFFLPFLEALIH